MARFRLFPPKEKRDVNFDLKGGTLSLLNAQGDIPVTQKTAMNFTGVMAAVSLRSVLLASFPKSIFQISQDSRSEIPNDPLYKILAFRAAMR